MNAHLIFHTATIAKYQKMYIITIHSYPFAELVGRNTTRKVRLTLKNNSYVYIPVDKLAAIIDKGCPPFSWLEYCRQLDKEGWEEAVCINCWRSWLKDGE